MRTKNIIFASSGTGGHIYPALVLAKEFKDKGYVPIFFIRKNIISIEILRESGFKYVIFNVSGIPKKKSLSFVVFLIKIHITFLKALKKIMNLRPLAVIGTGGYLAVPVLIAAKILNKKIFIHEQNAIAGKSNIFLNKITDKTFISFQSSGKYFKNKNIVVSGHPIRDIILSVSKKKALKILNLRNNIFTILVFGGSLGAVKLNKIACETFFEISLNNKIQVLHITGFEDYSRVYERVKNNLNYKVFKYVHNIAYAYVVSDVVVCRSGAGTVFELKALNKLAILIPYPYATNNHQYFNAKEIEKDKRIIIVEEKNLTKKRLINTLYSFKKISIKNNAINNIAKLPQKLIFEEIIKCIKS